MAATTAAVIEALPVDGERPRATGVRVFGGGSRSPLFLDALRQRIDLTVSVGPIEASALGNALAQGIALGVFADARAARATLGDPQEVTP